MTSAHERLQAHTITNPAMSAQRAVLAELLTEVAAMVEDPAGATPDEDPQAARELAAEYRRLSAAVRENRVRFVDLAAVRNLLHTLEAHGELALEHRELLALIARALEAALPERAQIMVQGAREQVTERGYGIQGVLADEHDPLQMPAFTYTYGLSEQGLTDFLVAGIGPSAAGAVLQALADAALAGQDLSAGMVVSGLLEGGLRIRLVDADAHVELMRMSTCPVPQRRLLHAQIPDPEGRLPGEPGCDPDYNANQTLPST